MPPGSVMNSLTPYSKQEKKFTRNIVENFEREINWQMLARRKSFENFKVIFFSNTYNHKKIEQRFAALSIETLT
ncbi:hypothetical protein Anas_10709 [Armadillidium nasatum]|uniref:Uncharacterized protein n=1 Tax=Armadillidium nasatum TaxID=96803 RepID=A0A5N5T2B3_9CRUS|nr:hypothetical protein Anas_10709 [Armadillidium nasatum]